MGRSVMTHPDAEVTAYLSWAEEHISLCRYCDEEVVHTYDGWVLEADNDASYCPARALELQADYGTPYANIEAEAKHEGWDYDSDNFENDVEATVEYMKELWPSLHDTDRWVGNEVHVVLESGVVEVSISEYCGLVALCIAPRSDLYHEAHVGLAKHWIEQVSERFRRTFGAYARLGTFSNGESVYIKEDRT